MATNTELIEVNFKDVRHKALKLIEAEANHAAEKYPEYHSMHEGYGVLAEEVYEFMRELHFDDEKAAVNEMIQVAAVALRFVARFGGKYFEDLT